MLPDLGAEIKVALEGLWSTAAVPGSPKAAAELALSCTAGGLPGDLNLRAIADRTFMIMLQDSMDPLDFHPRA